MYKITDNFTKIDEDSYSYDAFYELPLGFRHDDTRSSSRGELIHWDDYWRFCSENGEILSAEDIANIAEGLEYLNNLVCPNSCSCPCHKN